MGLLKRFLEKFKCASSCSVGEEYCPDKCKDYFDNIHDLKINSKDTLKIYKILDKINHANKASLI